MLPRRDFFKLTGTAAAGLVFSNWPVMAGPFSREDFDHWVPADKKLHPDWVKSLFARGEPTVYRGKELRFIGMPVGGICAGQLYLGGDGKLWCWDIFNLWPATGDAHYAHPPEPSSPLEQSFSLQLGERIIPLDKSGFSDVAFCGQYPIGTVEYKDPNVPCEVKLEAFSPFIPLNTDDSSLPATVMQFTIRNSSNAELAATLLGSLENGVCLHHHEKRGTRRNQLIQGSGYTFLESSAQPPAPTQSPPRPDILFEDWNKSDYSGWTVTGTAFGSGPILKSAIPGYQGDVGGDTERVVNTHASAPGNSVEQRDHAMGQLTSRPFLIERHFIKFWIGGGSHKNKTCLNLKVDGKVVRSTTGQDDNRMTLQFFDVSELEGKQAVLEVVDDETGPWGNIGLGRIVFTDHDEGALALEQLPDYGTMGLGLLGAPADVDSGNQTKRLAEKIVGKLGRKLKLKPGQSETVTFIFAWHFPNLNRLPNIAKQGRYYATPFDSAHAVASHIAENFDRLAGQTRLWRDTWYDSTLPFWFLDRTFLNTSTLATSTSYRFADGRFYGWEGVGCCAGTCGHVYHYAHAIARIFPELERITRERVDFGLALQPDGAIHFRAEANQIPAVDGQAGTILRALREHQMTDSNEFLQRNWPGIKRATEWLIAKDANNDGIIESNQHNTLDTDWFGAVARLSGLYLAALQAAAAMADVMGDTAFASQCRKIVEAGRKHLVEQLFDGEYFINQVDPRHLDAINSGTGCEIDQVFAQSWAFQVGLPRVLPQNETAAALKSLWRYNFTPDAGSYRSIYKSGRWYALAGEAGLLMCSFPRRDWDYAQAKGKGPEWAAGYFNECMNGFEHQVAGHMIWEGMLLEGLAVERAVHDRYHASRRNPWNEVECGDHYARSMASYGVFLAACGFEYDGSKAHIAFSPKLTPEHFRSAFTSATAWGSFSQQKKNHHWHAEMSVRWGKMRVKSIGLEFPQVDSFHVHVGTKEWPATVRRTDQRVVILLAQPAVLEPGQTLSITAS